MIVFISQKDKRINGFSFIYIWSNENTVPNGTKMAATLFRDGRKMA